jgi:purine-binding chemotaxis protein CheW
MGGPTQAVLAFRAGERRFGIRADEVREVARLPVLTPVPRAPESFLGIGNIRGEAVGVLSLAALLAEPGGAQRQMILLRGSGEGTALAIDRVEGMVGGEDLEILDHAALVQAALPQGAVRLGASRAGADSAAPTREAWCNLLFFTLGDRLFAFPAEKVVGADRVGSRIDRVPEGAPAAAGTILWRGRSLPVYTLAVLLGLVARTADKAQLLVVMIGGAEVGLLVDRIEKLGRVPVGRIDPLPASLKRQIESEAQIEAVVRLERGGRLAALLSPDQLLQEDKTAKLRMAAPERRQVAESAFSERETLLAFMSAGRRFALPLRHVREVVRLPATLARMPRMPAWLRGIANHRGEALPVVDLAAHLGGTSSPEARALLLVVTVGGTKAGLLVEAVEGLKHVAAASLPVLGEDVALRGAAVTDSGEAVPSLLSPDGLFSQIEAELIAGVKGGQAEA